MSRPSPRRALAVAAAAGLVAVGAVVATGASATDSELIRPFRAEVPALPLPTPEPAGERDDGDGDPPAAEEAPTSASDTATQAEGRPASGAPTDAEVAAELREAFKLPEGQGSSGRDIVDSATLTADGLATVPPTAPPKVRAIIHAANQVARKPYVYGGGHGRFAESVWIDTAYDCSGSISYAFAAAGLIDHPMVSGALAEFGKPGPGKWVTIYANGGHAFMTVGGLRFDTSGRQNTGSRWQATTRSTAGFTVRHPKGL